MRLRGDVLPILVGVLLRELRPEKHNHRRVVDPDQDKDDGARRTVSRAGVGGAQVPADEELANREEQRCDQGANQRVFPADVGVGQILHNQGKEQGDQAK